MKLSSTFAIECPNCGKYVQAKTFLGGLFGTKQLTCSCGYVIDVKTEKLSSRKCEHCGNEVVFDQTKGEKATCPVCGHPVNTPALQQRFVNIPCEQCGLTLSAEKDSGTAICPLCGHETDVVQALARAKANDRPAVLKFEGPQETLVWKHPLEDFVYGSQLIVHESQEAIFFRDGQALDTFGPGRHTLETQRLPLVGKVGAPNVTNGEMFHAEVYFVNLATILGLKWGTDTKVRLFDPTSGLPIELGASGEFNLHVTDGRKLLLKVIGTGRELTGDQLLGLGNGKGYFRAMVMTQVKSGLAWCIKASAINILEIDERLAELSTALQADINAELAKFGVEISEFMVSRVLTPDDDPNWQRLRQQHADLYLKVREEEIRKREAEAKAQRMFVEAEAKAQIRAIEAGGEAEALRRMAAAEAEKMRMQGYTYQQETQRQVGLQALKHGLPGGGGGGSGGGASPIGDMAALGVAMGVMGPIMQATQQATAPAFQAMGGAMGGDSPDTWDCTKCGAKGLTAKFCPECGTPKPTPGTTWDCPKCGAKALTAKFCPECGEKRPEPATWDCPKCGAKGLTAKFCPECGTPRSMPDATWDCPKCGAKGLTAKFCPECGQTRP